VRPSEAVPLRLAEPRWKEPRWLGRSCASRMAASIQKKMEREFFRGGLTGGRVVRPGLRYASGLAPVRSRLVPDLEAAGLPTKREVGEE
jgi:hypothetical protein